MRLKGGDLLGKPALLVVPLFQVLPPLTAKPPSHTEELCRVLLLTQSSVSLFCSLTNIVFLSQVTLRQTFILEVGIDTYLTVR